MELITSTSAAVVVAVLGLGTLAPMAMAQDQGPQTGSEVSRPEPRFHHFNHDGPRPHGMQRGMPGGIFGLVCSERGAERLEHMFVSVSYRLELTAEQTPLFDALRNEAITAQTGFADTCASLRPEAGQAAETPNLIERLQTRIEIDEARAAALSGLMPSIEAFYNSLTDEQQAKLDAAGGMRRGPIGKRQGAVDVRPDPHRQIVQRHS